MGVINAIAMIIATVLAVVFFAASLHMGHPFGMSVLVLCVMFIGTWLGIWLAIGVCIFIGMYFMAYALFWIFVFFVISVGAVFSLLIGII